MTEWLFILPMYYVVLHIL